MKTPTVFKQLQSKTQEDISDVVFPKYKKGGYMVKKVLTNATYGKVQNEA